MANEEHLTILGRGEEVWNRWRVEHSNVDPDLSKADLVGKDLRGFELSSVNLNGAILDGVRLNGANLVGADLRDSILSNANLCGADMSHANLKGAHLAGGNFTFANLTKASLIDTGLGGADFSFATLTEAELGHARCFSTVFGGVDLSEVKGLETILHAGPSSIGIDTMYLSAGKIPYLFLREAGVSEDVIEHLLPLIRTGNSPIQVQSCFISYSHSDEDFAKRLHARMRQEKLRVWFDDKDMKGGRKLQEQIFEAIQVHDRLLLVLSEASMASEWVMTEIRRARATEKKENRHKLFPIRLVDFDRLKGWSCIDVDTQEDLAVEVRDYFIPNFSNWKDHDAFEDEFGKLLDNLKVEGKRDSAHRPEA